MTVRDAPDAIASVSPRIPPSIVRRVLALPGPADLAMYFSPTNPISIGTVATPTTVTKTVRIPYTMLQVVGAGDDVVLAKGYVHPASVPAHMDLEGHFVFPRGVTVTAWRARAYRASVNETVICQLHRLSDTGANTILDTLTHNTTGWTTLSGVLSELIAAEDYIFTLEIAAGSLSAITDARFAYVEVDYAVPDYIKNI